jgi:glycosyltransferase involved in cell wall biosynthesis
VPPEDTRALREAVAELAADRTTLTRHGWAARGRFEAQPTWQTTVDRTVEFFEQARGRRPTDPEAPQRSP